MKLLIVLLAAAAVQAQVKIEKATWHGWADAIVMKNATAAVVIVPSIGRVMQFSLLDKTGQPTEGPMWNNRAPPVKSSFSPTAKICNSPTPVWKTPCRPA